MGHVLPLGSPTGGFGLSGCSQGAVEVGCTVFVLGDKALGASALQERGGSAVAAPNPLESQLEELLQPKTGEKTQHHLQYVALSAVQIISAKGMQQGY